MYQLLSMIEDIVDMIAKTIPRFIIQFYTRQVKADLTP